MKISTTIVFEELLKSDELGKGLWLHKGVLVQVRHLIS